MSEDELAAVIDRAIAETGATSAAQMGQVMASVRQAVGGSADMGLVSQLVRQRLS